MINFIKKFRKKKNKEVSSKDSGIAYDPQSKVEKERKIWKKVLLVAVLLLLVGGVGFAWKTGHVLNKVSTKGHILENFVRAIPGVENKLNGEDDGIINILLLGMRGKNVVGGGQLADTIMVASININENKGSLFSVPRDLQVTVPGTNTKSKINAVYYYGEEKKEGQGLEDMKKIIGEIVGDDIHYAASINFSGFTRLVDSLEGVDLYLEEPFVEPKQFKEEHVCDEHTFTVPSGSFEEKINEKGRVVARYPLCYNKDLECGGVFEVPAGEVNLSGERALCYVRARVTSSDFDRARRQQEVLEQIKSKAMNLGILGSFGKANELLNNLGDNVRTDMQLWEMKRMFEIYQNMNGVDLKQFVLENSEKGLLYAPENTAPEVGYILLPRGDNYERIHRKFDNRFK